jgi:glucose dehydrogenase
MVRTSFRSVLALVFIIVGLMWVVPRTSGQVFVGSPAPQQFSAQGQPSTRNGEWWSNGADLKGTRYSPLEQINASNFNTLEVAWRFKTDNFGPFPEFKLEGTPLMIKGVLYTTAGSRRSVVALDAKTGEVIWSHSLREGNAPRSPLASCRAVVCRTGPTAKATSASSTSRRAIASWSSMRKQDP